jgi:hypothetical protein
MEDLIANQKKKTLAVSVLCRKIERERGREGGDKNWKIGTPFCPNNM